MWAFATTLAKLHMGFYIYIAHMLLNYVDRGERTVRLELYVMVDEGPKGGDEVRGLVVEVLVPGDVL